MCILVGFMALLSVIAAVSVPNAVQAGDAGEFSTIMLRGGVPHPSGYPWMRILGLPARMLEWSGMAPATAAALPCAALAVAGFTLAAISLAHLTSPVLSFTVIALIAISPLAIRHAYDAEIWGPHLFFCGLVLLLAVQRRGALIIGLALGAAIANHLTAVLLIPIAVGAAWPDPLDRRSLLRAGALGVLGSAVCLIVFATLAIGDGGAWRWGDTSSLSGWLHHVTRGDFGALQLSIQKHDVPPLAARLGRVLTSIGDVWTIGALRTPWVVGSVLAATLWATRRSSRVRRPLYVGWVCSILLTTIVFPAAQNIDPSTAFGRWINERFDLLPALLWAPVIASALHRASSFEASRRLRPVLIPALGMLVAAQFARAWHERPQLLQGTETYANDMLRNPGSEDAIIFGTDDHRTFPALYVSSVSPAPGHALYIDAALLYHPWYRKWLNRQRPELPLRNLPLNTITEILQTPHLADTPIYLANVFSRPASRMPLVPEGVLLRVVPPHAPAEFTAPDALAQRHLEATARLSGTREQFRGAEDPEVDPFGADLWGRYILGASELTRNFDAVGRPDLADKIVADALDRGITLEELRRAPEPPIEGGDVPR